MFRYRYIICFILILLSYSCSDQSSVLDEEEVLPLLTGVENKVSYWEPVLFKINTNAEYTYKIYLNGESIEPDTSYRVALPGYYEVEIFYEHLLNGQKYYEKVQFIILHPVRGWADWGLSCPDLKNYSIPVISDYNTPLIEVISPKSYPVNLPLPIIVNIKESSIIIPVYNYADFSFSSELLEIQRGVGSVILYDHNTSVGSFDVSIDSETSDLKAITFTENPVWIEKAGLIETQSWNSFSFISILSDVQIPAGETLTIEEGTIIKVSNNADFICDGNIIINGTIANPVVFTSASKEEYWGGFIFSDTTTDFTATGAIFINSGANSKDYSWGHAGGQPLFFFQDLSTILLNNSYIINTKTQAFGGTGASVTIQNSLIQRAQSAGQFNASDVLIENSYLLDFPDSSRNYIDNDNDALYFAASATATLNNTVIINCKDDGIDSGNMGDLTINNCWIESCFHEGLALTSTDNDVIQHTIYNTVIRNCGQGIELGYSNVEHRVDIDHCLIMENEIGIRHGDNYSWEGSGGSLIVENSILIENLKDIWDFHQFNWNPSMRISVNNSLLSTYNELFQNNIIGEPNMDSRYRLTSDSIGYNAGSDGLSMGLID